MHHCTGGVRGKDAERKHVIIDLIASVEKANS